MATLQSWQNAASLAYLASTGGNPSVKKDLSEAIRWIQPAVAMEQANAEYTFAKILTMIPDRVMEALPLLQKSAAQGHIHPQNLLGQWYEGKFVKSEANPELALEWHSKAADQGHTESMLYAAERYADRKILHSIRYVPSTSIPMLLRRCQTHFYLSYR